MTPHDFEKNWSNIENPLTPLTLFSLERFNLSKSTVDFLSNSGLPTYAEPNLSFVIDTDDVFYGINKLTERFDLYDKKSEFEKYIVIGSCRDGNQIAIDTGDNDKIVELDHEDLFSPMFFNSSIETLADFLIIYRDFETDVLKGKDPDDDFQCFNFTDQRFEKLRNSFYLADSKALTEKGFWKEELEIMLTIRKEKFATH
jgi:hypothetical protein